MRKYAGDARVRNVQRFLAVLFLASLLACTSEAATTQPEQPPASDSLSLAAGYGYDGGWYQLYFTDPFSAAAASQTGGPDGPLVEAIDAARASVDVAAYSLTLNSVRDALLRAAKRGVSVRLVMESDNMDSSDVQRLIKAGVPVLGDRREGLMHNKFMVIDRSQVWTGSMNFTTSGTYQDNNDLIRIDSPELAKNYTTEFDEMFEDDLFGDRVRAATPYPDTSIDGTRIETLFSPDDHPATRISELLRGAQKSVYFLAYSFTSDEFGEILVERAEQRVKVEGVMEAEQVGSNQGTEYDRLRQAGIDVRLDGNPEYMHHKVFIIDGETVIFGSYNFSNSAETRNDENVLIIHSPELAGQFMQEFQRVYERAKAP